MVVFAIAILSKLGAGGYNGEEEVMPLFSPLSIVGRVRGRHGVTASSSRDWNGSGLLITA